MADRRVRVAIDGRVQGVFFRASLRDEATRRALAGWARNLPDGRLEAELQGADDAVEELVAWCWEGPPQARVTDVDVTELDVDPSLEGFAVR